ncbi:MAG: hypothetical protein ACOX6T_12985 [Myxococcales bacterium]|jgi:hypothetical protein
MIRTCAPIALIAVAACAGVRSNLADSPRARAIERVAIVGFDANLSPEVISQIPAPLFGSADLRQMVRAAVNGIEAPRGEGLYGAFASALEANSPWEVLRAKTIASDPAYQRASEKWLGASFGALGAEGILGSAAAELLSPAERAEIMSSLDADALLIVGLDYFPDQVSPPQITGERLWARIKWALHDAHPDPIASDEAHGRYSASGLPPLVDPRGLAELGKVMIDATALAAEALPFGSLPRQVGAQQERAQAAPALEAAPTRDQVEDRPSNQPHPSPPPTDPAETTPLASEPTSGARSE